MLPLNVSDMCRTRLRNQAYSDKHYLLLTRNSLVDHEGIDQTHDQSYLEVHAF
jgi:hypothetical protein